MSVGKLEFLWRLHEAQYASFKFLRVKLNFECAFDLQGVLQWLLLGDRLASWLRGEP